MIIYVNPEPFFALVLMKVSKTRLKVDRENYYGHVEIVFNYDEISFYLFQCLELETAEYIMHTILRRPVPIFNLRTSELFC